MVELDVGWEAVSFGLRGAGVVLKPGGAEGLIFENLVPVVEKDLDHLARNGSLFVRIGSNASGGVCV